MYGWKLSNDLSNDCLLLSVISGTPRTIEIWDLGDCSVVSFILTFYRQWGVLSISVQTCIS